MHLVRLLAYPPPMKRDGTLLRQVESVLKKGFAKLNDVCRADNRPECIFSHIDWEQLSELARILNPFKELTNQLQGEKV